MFSFAISKLSVPHATSPSCLYGVSRKCLPLGLLVLHVPEQALHFSPRISGRHSRESNLIEYLPRCPQSSSHRKPHIAWIVESCIRRNGREKELTKQILIKAWLKPLITIYRLVCASSLWTVSAIHSVVVDWMEIWVFVMCHFRSSRIVTQSEGHLDVIWE